MSGFGDCLDCVPRVVVRNVPLQVPAQGWTPNRFQLAGIIASAKLLNVPVPEFPLIIKLDSNPCFLEL